LTLVATSSRPARRSPGTIPPGTLPRKHRLMLLLAFEILVFGLGQAHFNPVKRGVVVDVSTTPNHVVT